DRCSHEVPHPTGDAPRRPRQPKGTTHMTTTWTKANASGSIQTAGEAQLQKSKAGVILSVAGEVVGTFPTIPAAKSHWATMKLATGEPRVTDAPAPKATTKKASKSVEAAMADRTPEAAAKKAPRPKVELHDHCPICGYAFPKPKARYRTKAACEKRAAAR